MELTQLDPVNECPRIKTVPRANLIEDGEANLLHQQLNVYRVNEGKHTDIHTSAQRERESNANNFPSWLNTIVQQFALLLHIRKISAQKLAIIMLLRLSSIL